jgi:energy-coupling factor transporter ATP-binding protein EcfA2
VFQNSLKILKIMYLQKVSIHNIRSIENFEMEFPNPAGWHTLIGDNGSGKSTIIRAIAATLIGPEQIGTVLPVWSEWLMQKKKEGFIELQLFQDKEYDKSGAGKPSKDKLLINRFELARQQERIILKTNIHTKPFPPKNYNWGVNKGWFSVAYGAFRRFTGGNDKWSKVYFSAPKAGAHLSVFGEDIALTEALDWVKELDHRRLKQQEDMEGALFMNAPVPSEEAHLFNCIKNIINNIDLLPNGVQFEKVDRNGELIFRDANHLSVTIQDMSDGFRSILSLTLELIRQLILVYSVKVVFPEKDSHSKDIQIKLPGVVLIDEIDVHLHPTWQTKIGKWFTKHFPNIQFIVATHSPLVCRACDKGSIWRLATPNQKMPAGEVKGIDKERLIYGNILDAYGTEIFGESPARSESNKGHLKRLGYLSMLAAHGKISAEEEKERISLQQIHTTDAPIGY